MSLLRNVGKSYSALRCGLRVRCGLGEKSPSQPSKRMTQVGSHKVHEDSKVHKVAGDHTSRVSRKPL